MVRRRTLLRGVVGVAGTTIAAPLASVAADDHQSPPALVSRLAPLLRNPCVGAAELIFPGAAPPAISSLREDVQASRYDKLEYTIPAAVITALTTRSGLGGMDAERADAQLASLFNIVSEAMIKFGELDLAHAAAAHSSVYAERSGDMFALAESAQMRAILARKAGIFTDAVAEVVKAADRLDSDSSPLTLSARGSLLNTAGYAAARAGDREGSRELLDAAAAMAAQLGGDRNWRHTAFGPTNVTFYRIGAADALGNPDQAISLAKTVPIDAVPYAERRVRFWLDVARAFDHWGRPGSCLEALLKAERSAPIEVRSREVTRTLVGRLLNTNRRVDARALRRLAGQVGLSP
jgi:hypothetical protein